MMDATRAPALFVLARPSYSHQKLPPPPLVSDKMKPVLRYAENVGPAAQRLANHGYLPLIALLPR